MKNIIIKVLVLFTFAAICSCEDAFLTENPRGETFAENLFNDKDGFQQVLNATFALVRQERTEAGDASMERSIIWKAGTDAYWGNYTFASQRAFDEYGANLNAADGTLNSVFNWLYDVVNASNGVITRAELPTVDWKGINAEEDLKNKNQVIAQARLFRAWAYRHLTYSWGEVPLSLEEITGDNFKVYWPRDNIDTIRAQMERDLLFAEEHLPDNYDDPLVLSRVVAQHYLAELYLTIGNNILAEEKAEAVINNNNFSLIRERFGAGAGLPGVPFMDQFNSESALPSDGNTETLWTFLNALDLSGSARVTMRRTWVNRYYNLTTDDTWAFSQYGGRGIGRMAHTPYVESLYEPNDDRYSQYAISKFYLKAEGGDTVFTAAPDFASWKQSDASFPGTKKWDSYPDIDRVDDPGQFNNMPYLRLAETYLLLAEAEMKLSKTDEAADHLNELRSRSNASLIDASDVTIEFILDERARELLSEEHRRHTLNRLGLLISRTKLHHKFAGNITERDLLFPIPQEFIDANEGITRQNPDY